MADDETMKKTNSLYSGAGSEFDESKHPRDEDGKFTYGGGISTERQEKTVMGNKSANKKAIADKLGVEFKDVKGAEAIEKLLTEKQGHVKAAFSHNVIGDIDLLWGDEQSGLAHIIKRRDEDFNKGVRKVRGVDMARKIPQIIEKGTSSFNKKRKCFEIEYKNERVVVSPQMYGDNSIKWVLTAYELN